MSDFAVSPVPNVPDWKADGNSPQSADGVTEISLSVSDTAGAYHVVIRADSTDTTSGDWALSANGETSGYGAVENGDTTVSGNSEWVLAPSANPSQGIFVRATLTTDEGSNSVGGPCAVSGLFGPVAGTPIALSNSILSDLNSLTLTHSGAASIRGSIEVYGRPMP